MRRARFLVAVPVVALVAAGCSGGGSAERAEVKAKVTRSTSTTSTSTTTTAPPPPAPVGLRLGASGPEVLALQQRLAALHYDVPAVDGRFGAGTQQAVIAFQKVEGLGRDGVAGPQTMARLQSAGAPGPMVPAGGGTRVEVDVARQVLFFYKGGSLFKTVAVSSGSGERFCVSGRCATAVTPGGSFRVRGKVSGWQTGALGRLYKPSYFNGNIAIHGALSVPAYPASHGCVRVPMSSADWIYAALAPGTPVYVLNGPKAPVPFGSSAPPNLTPDANQAPGDVTPLPPTTVPTAAPPPPSTVPPSSRTTSSSTTTSSTTTPPST